MELTQKKSGENVVSVRDRLLNAAFTVIQETGRVAQPQVAKAAGVPQGHLTYYFPKKVDLLKAVGARFAEEIAGELASAVKDFDPSAASPDQGEIRRTVLRFVTNRKRTRTLVGLIGEGERHPEVLEGLRRGAEMMRSIIGHVNGLEPAEPRVHFILASIWGIAIQHLLFTDRSSSETESLLQALYDTVDSW